MTAYVAKHRDLPVPILLSDAQRAVVNEAIRTRQNAVMIGQSTIPTFNLFVLEQRLFLENDREELRRHMASRCRWGQVHRLVDEQVKHSLVCRPSVRRDSPYVLPETWTEPLPSEQPAASQPAAIPITREKSVARTEKALDDGREVFRTLVRLYRSHPTLVSDRYARLCAAFNGVGIDQVPKMCPALGEASVVTEARSAPAS